VPVSDRAELADIAAGRVESTGDRVPDTRIDVAEELAAGQVVKYRLEVPVDDLPWSSAGVYVLGVEALGAVADGANARLGLARTFLPWIPPTAGVVAGGVVTLWPLAAAPAVDAEGVLLTPALPTAVSAGGRLRILLDTGSAVPGSWLGGGSRDAEAVSQMTDGYRVSTADGPAAGTAVPAAAGWLATARTALGSADVSAMPYAWPDAVALVRGGLQRDVVRATTAAPGAAGVVLQRPVTTTLAWPPGGTIDTETLAVLGDTGASGVLLSDTQLRPDPRSTSPRRGPHRCRPWPRSGGPWWPTRCSPGPWPAVPPRRRRSPWPGPGSWPSWRSSPSSSPRPRAPWSWPRRWRGGRAYAHRRAELFAAVGASDVVVGLLAASPPAPYPERGERALPSTFVARIAATERRPPPRRIVAPPTEPVRRGSAAAIGLGVLAC
jgi:hypothetical protein